MEEIGRRLEAVRLAKGLTLQDVEEETHIRKKYLEALETGRLTDIPGDVYVKGFLRTYGNFLGLDGEAVVEEYKRSQSRPASAAEGLKGSGAAEAHPQEPRRAPPRRESPVERQPESTASARPAQERPPRRPAGSASRPRSKAPSTFLVRRAVVALLVTLPLAGVGYWLWGQMTAQPQPPPITQKEEPPAVQTPEPESKPPAPAPEPPKPTVTMNGPRGANIDFTVSVSPVEVAIQGFREGFPWVQVFADGKEAFVGKLTGPVTYTGREVSMIVGFGQGVDLVINGQTFPLPAGGAYTIKVTGQP